MPYARSLEVDVARCLRTIAALRRQDGLDPAMFAASPRPCRPCPPRRRAATRPPRRATPGRWATRRPATARSPVRTGSGSSGRAKALGMPVAFTDAEALADLFGPLRLRPGHRRQRHRPGGDGRPGLLGPRRASGRQQARGLLGDLSLGNVAHVKQAIDLCGGVLIPGFLDLPDSAERQADAGEPWSIPLVLPRNLGGHCVVAFEYDEYYVYVGTWGKGQPVNLGLLCQVLRRGLRTRRPELDRPRRQDAGRPDAGRPGRPT